MYERPDVLEAQDQQLDRVESMGQPDLSRPLACGDRVRLLKANRQKAFGAHWPLVVRQRHRRSIRSSWRRAEVRYPIAPHLAAASSMHAGDVDGQPPVEPVLLQPWVPHAKNAVR
jgi:hypothetical protein